MLKPFRLNLQKYVGLMDILDDKRAIEDFLRMEKWIFDSPDLAGEAFRDFIKQFDPTLELDRLESGPEQPGGRALEESFEEPLDGGQRRHDESQNGNVRRRI